MLEFSKWDWRRGAIYRLAAKRQMDRETITILLAERGGLKPESAAQLAAHWIGTEPLRQRKADNRDSAA